MVFCGAAVHRVHQLQLLDPEVVVRLHLGEDFLDRARARVASRLAERHRRRLIVEHVDRVLRRGVDLLALRARRARCGRSRAADSVKLPASVPSACTVSGAAPPSLNRICPPDVFIVGVMCSSTLGAAQRRDVAAVFVLARRQVRVGGEVVLQLELRDGRQIDDRQRVVQATARRSTRRNTPSACRGGTSCLRTWRHRRWRRAAGVRTRGAGRCASSTSTSFDAKPISFALHRLVAAARHAGVPGRDFDLVRARRFGAAGRR